MFSQALIQNISAQANPQDATPTGLSAELDTTVNLHSGLQADIAYTLTINNNTQQLVSNITLQLPATTFVIHSAKLGDITLQPQTTVNNTGGSINLSFAGNSIRPGASAIITLNITVPNMVKNHFGYTEFYLPVFDTSFPLVQKQLQITFPSDYPELAFASGVKFNANDKSITLGQIQDALLIWGKESYIDMQAEWPVVSDVESFISLPNSDTLQDVVFTKLNGFSSGIADTNSNLWGVVNPTVEGQQVLSWGAKIHRLDYKSTSAIALDFPSYDELTSISLPQDLGDMSNRSQGEKIETILAYLQKNYEASYDISNQLNKYTTELPPASTKLSNLDLVILAAKLMRAAGLDPRIAFGYTSFPTDIAGFQVTKPHLWLENITESGLSIVDPFWQDLTAINGFAIPNFTRVQFGLWIPEYSFEGVLGLSVNRPAPRPSFAQIKETNAQLEYEIQAEFPEQVLSGIPFDAKLRVVNRSGRPLDIDQIRVDGQIIETSTRAGINQFRKVVLPLTVTKLELNGLRNPEILGAYTQNGRITLQPTDPYFQVQTTKFSVTYRPNYGLFVLVVALVFGSISLGLIYFFRRTLLVNILKRRYL